MSAREISIFLSSLILSAGHLYFSEVLLKDYSSNGIDYYITYIGHATVLIHFKNINILTDPVFSESINFGLSKRYVEPGISFERLPKIDAILISHGHSDHFDKPTLKRFDRNIPIILSKGIGCKMKSLVFTDVRELEWWESTMIKKVKITATPAKHIFSAISSYVIEGSKTVFFAGDTGLFDGFNEIGQKFKIDMAVLPIGDYHPRLWFIHGFRKMTRSRHMAPLDIPDAIEMLQTKMVIPIHWGTFKISGTGVNDPIELLKEIMKQERLYDKVLILKHGETKAF